MGKRTDLTGQRFGRLVVLKYISRSKENRYGKWMCKCDCGNVTFVTACHLNDGHTSSCGCYRRDYTGNSHRTHGLTGSKLDSAYYNMMQRCYREKDDHYASYGGRGIEVCEEWRNKENGKMNFFKWAWENGYEEGLSIERIDVNGNYCPNNCKWIPLSDQKKNMRPKQHKYGYPGIYQRKDNGKYAAYIKINGMQMTVGTFDTAEQAYKAYLMAKEQGYIDFKSNRDRQRIKKEEGKENA